MIQYQLELRMTKTQEKIAESWLPILGSVCNFAVRKIGLNAKDKIYFSKPEFQNLANHPGGIIQQRQYQGNGQEIW
jgi:hypothetical protein